MESEAAVKRNLCGVSGEKRCTGCKQSKPLDDFARSSKRKSGHNVRCKQCDHQRYLDNIEQAKQASHLRYAQNREKIRAQQNAARNNEQWKRKAREVQLRYKFGITHEDYEKILSTQGGVCAICGGPPVGRWKHFHVDHDHKTGKVRGLLCAKCNTALGLLNDSPDNLSKAILYLGKHS